MAYVVTEHCIRCKYMECVELCPVDCFREGENMLVIDPESCIDCGVCEGECPAEAIQPGNLAQGEPWGELNAKYAKLWPTLTTRGKPPADAEKFDGTDNKFESYFSAEAGRGD